MLPQALFGEGAERQPLREIAGSKQATTFSARCFVALSTVALAALFCWGLTQALALGSGGTVLHYAFLIVSTLGFSWIAFGAVNSILGAYVLSMNLPADTVHLASAETPLATRTALLFPIYHESPDVIAETISKLADDLEQQCIIDHFEVFVLSDSQEPLKRGAEASIFGELAQTLAPRLRCTYRNRDQNIGKKAGNIADWVTRWGQDFEHFVVFDADSRMSAATLSRLVATMQQNRDTALIQTVPALEGSHTIFGQIQEFASALSGRIAAAGFASWQGSAGNYWGHNAILRTKAFADSAGLPLLPGRPPFGGHIQSHDFVEAALLHRAGWRVALVTSLDGSYEGAPQSLIDMAVRDRRWMQGNLQHSIILRADGLRPVSRIHLAMGIASYLSSALWATMIVLGLFLVWQEQERALIYFSNQKTLFPVWPIFDPQAGLRLVIATMIVVFLPKLVGLGLAVFASGRRGLGPLIASWWIEVIYSTLLAPVSMMLHLKGLFEIATGRDSGWQSQNRGGSKISFSEAMRFHTFHISAGLALAACAMVLSWHAFLWLSPMAIGLVVSPLLTVLTSLPASRPTWKMARS